MYKAGVTSLLRVRGYNKVRLIVSDMFSFDNGPN